MSQPSHAPRQNWKFKYSSYLNVYTLWPLPVLFSVRSSSSRSCLIELKQWRMWVACPKSTSPRNWYREHLGLNLSKIVHADKKTKQNTQLLPTRKKKKFLVKEEFIFQTRRTHARLEMAVGEMKVWPWNTAWETLEENIVKVALQR